MNSSHINFLNDANKTAPKNLLADVINLAKSKKNVIDLTVGDPDLPTPDPIIAVGVKSLQDHHTHYTAAAGLPQLRATIARLYRLKYALAITADNVMVTVGASHAALLALGAIVNPGDEVIIVEPAFTAYREQVTLAGGVPVGVELEAASGFKLDVTKVARAITAKTKAIIINFPNNPTGAVLDNATAHKLANLVKKHRLVVISDEIYSELVMEGFSFTPFAKFAPHNTITVSGASKNFAMTGWRLGYLLAAKEIITAVMNINENVTYSAPTPAQYAACYAFEHNDELSAPIRKVISARLEYLQSALDQIPWLSVTPIGGAIYAFCDITATGLDDVAFTHALLEQTGVLVVPGSAFGAAGAGCVRLAATQKLSVLQQAVVRIAAFKF